MTNDAKIADISIYRDDDGHYRVIIHNLEAGAFYRALGYNCTADAVKYDSLESLLRQLSVDVLSLSEIVS